MYGTGTMANYKINGWDALIEACQIFKQYGSERAVSPLHCEHDVLYVCDSIDPAQVSAEHKARLEELGFDIGDPQGGDESGFYSYRFGSA